MAREHLILLDWELAEGIDTGDEGSKAGGGVCGGGGGAGLEAWVAVLAPAAHSQAKHAPSHAVLGGHCAASGNVGMLRNKGFDDSFMSNPSSVATASVVSAGR